MTPRFALVKAKDGGQATWHLVKRVDVAGGTSRLYSLLWYFDDSHCKEGCMASICDCVAEGSDDPAAEFLELFTGDDRRRAEEWLASAMAQRILG